jgi:hypothetical protein
MWQMGPIELMHRDKRHRQFDHLICGGEQIGRHSDSKCLGGLGVDDQLDFGGLLHRQIGRLLAVEDAAGVNADLTQGPRFAAAQQSASKQPKPLLRAILFWA